MAKWMQDLPSIVKYSSPLFLTHAAANLNPVPLLPWIITSPAP
jgi:hypothetical protein